MTNNNNNNNNQVIHCPNCKASITVDELGEHVSANPDIKKQAIGEQFQLWGGVIGSRPQKSKNILKRVGYCSFVRSELT